MSSPAIGGSPNCASPTHHPFAHLVEGDSSSYGRWRWSNSIGAGDGDDARVVEWVYKVHKRLSNQYDKISSTRNHVITNRYIAEIFRQEPKRVCDNYYIAKIISTFFALSYFVTDFLKYDSNLGMKILIPLFLLPDSGSIDDSVQWLHNFERLQQLQSLVVWPSITELEPKSFIPDVHSCMDANKHMHIFRRHVLFSANPFRK